VQKLVRSRIQPWCDTVRTDVMGNVFGIRNPKGKPRIMLAGHCDQIGFIVQYIDADGFVWLLPVGGWDAQVMIGQKLTLWPKGKPISGVVARKPIHLLTDEERKIVPKIKDLWLDIGAKNKEEAAALISVGDPITLELGFRPMLNNLASAPGMDDKTGLWVAMEALRRTAGKPLRCALYAVSTVQEEIGLRGAMTSAFGIRPHVGIAIDVTHATDCPTIDKKQEGDISLGKGPVIWRGPNMNPRVVERLIAAARSREIPYQPGAQGRATPTDANTIQTSRAGVAASLLSIPNRYMHSPVEMISLDDIDRAADVLAEFALGLSGDEDFRP
jgi:endoglucanase